MVRSLPAASYAADLLGATLISKVRAVYRRDPTAFSEAYGLVSHICKRDEHAMRIFKSLNMRFQRGKSAHLGTSGLTGADRANKVS